MYKAIVCQLSNVRKHPDADRLKIAQALGYFVIVGEDAKDGDTGIIFPADGQLSEKMCLENNLYRKHPVTGEKMGGYLESRRRIKSVKLRGQVSDGLFLPLQSLDWAGKNNLKVGDEFDTINGNKICNKYYTEATRKAIKNNQGKKKYWWLLKPKDPCPDFKKHFDTTKLRNYSSMIPPGLKVYFSSKLHGTSARSGLVQYDNRSFLKKLLGFKAPFCYVMGSRNVTYNPYRKTKECSDFRQECHEKVIKNGLKKGEIIYYEIVGWAGSSTKIMPDHHISDKDLKESGINVKEFRALYGDTLSYTYGCKTGECKIFVYRITQGSKDLSNEAMIERCKELDLETVPQLGVFDSHHELLQQSEIFTRDSDGDGQLREGVCLRLEDNSGALLKILKYKSFIFCLCEGIQKNTDSYIDMEEVN